VAAPTDDGYAKVSTFADVFETVDRHRVKKITYLSMNTLASSVYIELIGDGGRHYGGTVVSSRSFSELQVQLDGKVKFLPL
jgi:hypothetical protein